MNDSAHSTMLLALIIQLFVARTWIVCRNPRYILFLITTVNDVDLWKFTRMTRVSLGDVVGRRGITRACRRIIPLILIPAM